MKLRAADLDTLPASGAKAPFAVLLHGEDAAQIAQRREALVTRWAGPEAEADMRLTRLTGAQLRSDPALLDEALRSQGFFPGVRVTVVTEATDGLAATVQQAGEDATGAEARLVVTAGLLTTRSALRRAFEGSRSLAAVPCYRGPLDAAALESALVAQGLTVVAPEARNALIQVSGEMDRLSFDQLLIKLALWHGDTPAPLTADDVAACAPPPEASDADDVMLAVFRREPTALCAALANVPTDAVGLCIALARQARQLLEARCAMDSDGQAADAALGRAVPPIPFPRRRVLAAVLGQWPRPELEALLTTINGIDRDLRSAGATTPGRAQIERALLRFALRGRR